MIQHQRPLQHELMKEILSLTMLLQTQYPGVYTHLDETPLFDGAQEGQEVKAMQDYRDTLASQLEEADTEKANQHKEMNAETGSTPA
ncbi:MAG TPA: hypothetical protein VNZ86_00465 [Bacteroidia bacterium]|jgi:hypothetical protein|nr:hypothetical protein [Bacteroidia bacterium]